MSLRAETGFIFAFQFSFDDAGFGSWIPSSSAPTAIAARSSSLRSRASAGRSETSASCFGLPSNLSAISRMACSAAGSPARASAIRLRAELLQDHAGAGLIKVAVSVQFRQIWMRDLLILDVGSDGDRRQIVVAQFAGVGVVPRDVGRLARLAI